MGGFRDPNEALRARADALEVRVDELERALREKNAEIERLAAAQADARVSAVSAQAARARVRVRNASRKPRPSTPPGEVRSAPTPRDGSMATPTRGAVVRASLAVAVGAVGLAAAPFAWVITQRVDGGNGWSAVLFAAAFLGASGAIVQLPAVCFGLLATGAEGVDSDGVNGETRTFRHTVPRARRALRWLVAWVVMVAACCVGMPSLP